MSARCSFLIIVNHIGEITFKVYYFSVSFYFYQTKEFSNNFCQLASRVKRVQYNLIYSITQNPMSIRSPIKRTIHTQPVKTLLKEKKTHTRYDESLFLKTSFHLQTKDRSQRKLKTIQMTPKKDSETTGTLTSQTLQSSRWKRNLSSSQRALPIIPNSVSIFKDPMRVFNEEIPETENYELLLERTKVLVSAKRWGVFQNHTQELFKGFKVKKQHEIASLTKIMTFYCAYLVIIKYYLIAQKFELLVDKEAQLKPGTKAFLIKDDLVTLLDLLYALMLNGGNDASHTITKNIGALIYKKNKGQYFSPYDILNEPTKDQYSRLFICLMNSAAKELKMTQTKFFNSHGMVQNTSTVKDLALVTYECLKIPLFKKIIATKKHEAKVRFINSVGQIEIRQLPLINTNKLLANQFYKGVKAANSQIGGGCLVTLYEEAPDINILVVVLGSSGKDSKFNDTDKLVQWYKKLYSIRKKIAFK